MALNLVLVTGASGYIAGHCILRLLDGGYRVRGTLRSLKREPEVRQWLGEDDMSRQAATPVATLSAK